MILTTLEEVHPARCPGGPGARLACNWRPGSRRHYESFWSSLQKFAFLNAVTPGVAAAMLRAHATDSAEGAGRLPDLGYSWGDAKRVNDLVNAFARLTGESAAGLRATGTLAGHLTARTPDLDWLEARLLRNLVSADQLRYCPLCVGGGFHTPLFQFLFVAECPLHGCGMAERCPSCARPIALAPGSAPAYGCPCGHLLWPGIESRPWSPPPDGARDAFRGVAAWLKTICIEAKMTRRTLILAPSGRIMHQGDPAAGSWARQRVELLPALWHHAVRIDGLDLPDLPSAVRRKPEAVHAHGGAVVATLCPPPTSYEVPRFKFQRAACQQGDYERIFSCHALGAYLSCQRWLRRRMLRTHPQEMRAWRRPDLAALSDSSRSGACPGGEGTVQTTAYVLWRMVWEGLFSAAEAFRVPRPARRCAPHPDDSYQQIVEGALSGGHLSKRYKELYDPLALGFLVGHLPSTQYHVLWRVFAASFTECILRVRAERARGNIIVPGLAGVLGPLFVLPGGGDSSALHVRQVGHALAANDEFLLGVSPSAARLNRTFLVPPGRHDDF